jgi:hypothetical protein
VRHRLETGDAEPLAPRRARDDGGAHIQLLQAVVRDESPRLRDARTQRAVAGHDQPHAVRRGHELEHALLLGEAAGVQDLRGLGLLAHLGRQVDAARDHAQLARAEALGGGGELRRGGDHEPRAAQDLTGEGGHPARELEVGAPHLNDERPPGPRRHPAGRQPVGVEDVRVDPPPRSHERGQHRRHERHEPRPRLQIADDPVAVGDAEVAEVLRRDDLDLDAAAQALDGVGDEASGRVARVPRIRRRQDADLQRRRGRAYTSGRASTRAANA